MSWMEDLDRDFRYRCAQGHVSHYRLSSSTPQEQIRADAVCLHCSEAATYEGFEPLKMSLMGKVSYEQNGRKAYKLTSNNGSVTYISKTKYDYLNSFGTTHTDERGNRGVATVRPAYTPAYEEHLKSTGQDHLLETTVIKNKVREQAKGVITPANNNGE